jgi:hypothetical protein
MLRCGFLQGPENDTEESAFPSQPILTDCILAPYMVILDSQRAAWALGFASRQDPEPSAPGGWFADRKKPGEF